MCVSKKADASSVFWLWSFASRILWNTETGLFCAVSWAAFWILRCLCSQKDSWVPILKTCLLHFAGILLSFMGAYAAVELYNIMNGGQITGIREFLFPLLQSSYMEGLLRVDLPEFASAYMISLCCFYGLSHGVFPTYGLSAHRKKLTVSIFSASALPLLPQFFP